MARVWDAPSCLQPGMSRPEAADTCFSQNPVDYFFWHYSASAVVFTNLVELAS